MNDLYQVVTERIIAALETGTPPWLCPWREGMALPANLATGKPYRGINVLMLACETMERGFADSRWLTLKQANALGGRIKRGERGAAVVFFKWRELDEDAPEEDDAPKRVVPLLRAYTVFNASQVEFLPERFNLGQQPQWQPVSEAETLLRESGALIRHGGSRACYLPGEDLIQLPPPGWFPEAEGYYATALHELAHWTGHPRRLDRPLGRRHGIDAYAYEELVAEMGAAFLCAHCGIPGHLEHASYIEQWLAALRHDKRLIFVAAGAAQKAADFVLGTAQHAPGPVAEALVA